ncbi:MAG: hypothetical protein IJ137_01150 [Eubacterium sp.]|nr:hypothetical protein [Eubacterium sp.]
MNKIFNKFNLTLNIWISVIINVALSIVLPLVAMGTVTLPIFLKGFAIAFPVSTIIVLLIPINRLGDMVASKFGLQPQTVPFTLVSTAVLAFILGSFMSLLMTYINAGAYTGLFTPAYFAAWFSCWGWALLAVYLSALVGIYTGLPLTMKLCGPPQGH